MTVDQIDLAGAGRGGGAESSVGNVAGATCAGAEAVGAALAAAGACDSGVTLAVATCVGLITLAKDGILISVSGPARPSTSRP